MLNKQATKVFTFNENNKPIRVEVINEEPWFVAKDVCDALGIEKYRDALGRLEEDEKGCPVTVDTLGGPQKMSAVNESGLYSLIFQSRKPEAKKFRKWVTSEVLPSIRKTGRYDMSQRGGAVRPRRSRSELVNAELLNLLWLIGDSLRQGELTEVALELGVSRQTVSHVLNGHARNPRVLMALYQRAKANRACGMIYHRPDVMAERLIDAEGGDVVVQMPTVVYETRKRVGQIGNQNARKRGGQIGNQNARKHWGKESK